MLVADIDNPALGQKAQTAESSRSVLSNERIDFEADRLEYDSEADVITASGNVVMVQNGQEVRAEEVLWNRKTGSILARGNIVLVDEAGNRLYTQEAELTEQFDSAAVKDLLIALSEGARIAARGGVRAEDGSIELTDASYSACAVIDPAECESPSWRITADRVIYDPIEKRIRFNGAYLELFGKRVLPLPGLKTTTDGRAVSGVLVPGLRISDSNGVEVSGSYYMRLADNRDLTLTGTVFTEVAPLASAQYRELTERGAFQVTGYATRSSRIPIGGEVIEDGEKDWRGYLFANGRYQIDENWSATAWLRVASDRTFLRRYDISRDDRLRSLVEVERIDEKSYLSIAGWATQTLRLNTPQGQVPLALPVIDYRRRIDEPLLGGVVELQANTLAIGRSEGQDTRRAFTSARWDLRKISPWGQEVTFSALARGDVYHSRENFLTETAIYRGESGWQTRAIAIGAVDVKWPLVGEFWGGTQVLSPRFQIVASPPIRNLNIPNEDARAVDLEDSNIFALNRFPGYDRLEDGVRFTYGLDWLLTRPNWRIKATVGQSYRLTEEPTILPDGTGLTNRTSDFVGRTEVRYKDFLSFTHRYRLDKDNIAVRRNEFDATLGTRRTYIEVGYLRLDRDIAAGIEDLQDREELRFAGRVAFKKYWSVFGSGVINLTDEEEDPSFQSDGFEPLRTRLGFGYDDGYLQFGVTWRRDFTATGDAERGNTFQINIALKNFGFR